MSILFWQLVSEGLSHPYLKKKNIKEKERYGEGKHFLKEENNV